MLVRAAERHGEKPAIVCGDVTWSYAAFRLEVDRLAAGLRHLGVASGDRIAILARNSHAFIALRFAIARADAVLVPINFMLNADDVRYILDHSGARLLFVDAHTITTALNAGGEQVEHLFGIDGEFTSPPTEVPSWVSLLRDETLPPELRGGEDLLQIVYTSGTESRPKGAMLSHNSVLWEYQSCIIDCEWTRDTTALHAMPLFHCAQLDCMIGPALHVGARNVITGSPAAENVLQLLTQHSITSFFAPPTVWISLLRSPTFANCDLSALVKGYYGASIMPVEVLREMRERLPQLRLWNLYGQTEIAPVATILFPEEHAQRLGSAGRPALHVETRIVNDHMVPVASGEIGEIVHRSPQLLSGYWNDPERTADCQDVQQQRLRRQYDRAREEEEQHERRERKQPERQRQAASEHRPLIGERRRPSRDEAIREHAPDVSDKLLRRSRERILRRRDIDPPHSVGNGSRPADAEGSRKGTQSCELGSVRLLMLDLNQRGICRC